MAYPPVSAPTTKAPPYSVNGLSLTSPNVDILHPAMSYQGENVYNVSFFLFILLNFKKSVSLKL